MFKCKSTFSIILIYTSIACSMSSCIRFTNTRQSMLSRQPTFQVDDIFIMDKIKGLTYNRSALLYDWAKYKSIDKLHRPLDYLPSKEYELFAQGLQKEELAVEGLSQNTKRLIHEVTGATYLLRVDVLGKYTNDRYANVYNLEPSYRNRSSATLKFHIIHLLDDTYSYSFRVKTSSDTFALYGIEETGISHTIFIADKAFRKGWRRVLRGMKD